MSRDAKSRDVTLSSLSVLTGGLTAVALVGTGVVMGLAAEQTAHKVQVKAESGAAALVAAPAVAAATVRPFVVLRAQTPRPTRTVVTTHVVQAASSVSGGSPGGTSGGTSGGSSGGTSGGSSGGTPVGYSGRSYGGSSAGTSGGTSGGSSSRAGVPVVRAPAPVVRAPAPAPAPAPPPAPSSAS